MGTYLKNYIGKDKQLHSMLARTGVATREQAEVFMGTRRLESHIKEGFLEEVKLIIKDREKEQEITLYKLTDLGKEMAREKCGIESFYGSSSPRHDIALADKYIELYKRDPELTRSWITESNVRDMLQAKVDELREQGRNYQADKLEQGIQQGRFSAFDGGYIENGEIHPIEIVSRHYKEETLEMKVRTIRVLGIKESNYEETYIN